jgi:putative transposase
MSSYTKLNYHFIFGTKYRRKNIVPDTKERLYEYLGGLIRSRKGHLIQIGGVEDHVHILTSLPPTFAVADVMRDIKAGSSAWVNETFSPKEKFEWQKGYGAFTVSYSQIEPVKQYIANQVEHHRNLTFQEEYIKFLERHGIRFEMQYLFEDEHHG